MLLQATFVSQQQSVWCVEISDVCHRPRINVSEQIPSGHVYLNIVSVLTQSRWAQLYSAMHQIKPDNPK